MAEAEKDDILSENGKPVRGNQGTITLRSKPVGEDTVIHIRAVKLFDPADRRPPLTAILSTSLPLYVRADPARIVTAPAIVGYKANTGIRIEASQASAAYRVWTRRIADEEYRHGAAAGSSTLAGKVVAIPVNGSPDAMVLVPAAPAGSSAPAGFAAEGTGIPGNGGQLQLPLIPPEEDLFIVVEVLKQHDVSDGPPASSSIWLAAVSPMLVKPDDKRQLRLQAEFGNGTTIGTLRVLDGQPGVFYTLKSASTKAVVGPPAYFHKLDATNPVFNKGIGQLKLGVDLVVTVNPSAPARKTLAETPPEPPLLPTDPLAEGTVIAFRAVKAQTGVAVDLAKTVTVTAPAAG
jgi:hypothetical protein